jgi:hypothetical protein
LINCMNWQRTGRCYGIESVALSTLVPANSEKKSEPRFGSSQTSGIVQMLPLSVARAKKVSAAEVIMERQWHRDSHIHVGEAVMRSSIRVALLDSSSALKAARCQLSASQSDGKAVGTGDQGSIDRRRHGRGASVGRDRRPCMFLPPQRQGSSPISGERA